MKYARIERERRFLLRPGLIDVALPQNFQRIKDMYVPGTYLRLRRIEAADGATLALKLTKKYPSPDGAATDAVITNIYLDDAEFKALNSLGGAPLQKRRYRLPIDRFQFSIDVFEGSLEGLILGEVEMAVNDDWTRLSLPPFVIEDVTDEPFFTGGMLAFAEPVMVRQQISRRLGP